MLFHNQLWLVAHWSEVRTVPASRSPILLNFILTKSDAVRPLADQLIYSLSPTRKTWLSAGLTISNLPLIEKLLSQASCGFIGATSLPSYIATTSWQVSLTREAGMPDQVQFPLDAETPAPPPGVSRTQPELLLYQIAALVIGPYKVQLI